jgi:MFS family permease
MGAASTSFTATTNSLLQLAAPTAMRGRVMAIWSVVYLGSTAVGGPIVGWVSEHAGPRAGLALGALATFATGAGLLMAARPPAARRRAVRSYLSQHLERELLQDGGRERECAGRGAVQTPAGRFIVR